MAAKRPAAGGDSGPAAKKPLLMQSPLFIPPATSQEDLDIKVLQVQNRKLSERLRERTRSQDQLQHRLDREEERTSQYGEVLSVVEAHLTDLKELLEGSAGNDEPLPLVKSLVGSSRDHALHQLEVFFTSLSSSISHHDNQSLAQLKESLEQGVSSDSPLLSKLEDLLSRREAGVAAYERLRKEAGSVSVQQLKGREEFLRNEQKRLETKLADTIFDHEKALSRIDLLESQLLSQHHQQQSLPSSSEGPLAAVPPLPTTKEGEPASSSSSTSGSSTSETPPTLVETKGKSMTNEEYESLQSEKEELTKTAESRLLEINQLTQHITELKQELEKNRLASLQVPDGAVKESSVYKALQTQYSILIMEQSQMKACYDEVRRLLLTAKTQHIVQLEEIRQEELKYQAEVREEMAQMELSLAHEKRAYEMLRVEHERMLASNELAAPIVKEMQQTLSSVQQSNQQLKAEVTRYKTRAHKAEEKLTKLQEDKESAAGEGPLPPATTLPASAADSKPSKEVHDLHERVKVLEGEKKSLEAKLEGFSSLSQEEREKADVLAGEKKALSQVEDMKKKFEEARKDYEKKREHLREDIKQLNRDLSSKKEEVQALMREMELTAQAFEDMQEQNIRLLQQLREKDDANFKLMSERIKANTMQKLLVEEKSLLQAEAATMNAERERLNLLVQRLEERDKHSEQTLAASEKELNLKQQALDLHKKRAVDSVQAAHEVQLKVVELETQLTSTRQSLMGKTDECEREALSTRRCQEEINGLRRKLEKYKTREWASAGDEVLLEEIKTYKAKLNCPCCSSRKKDTVLTKCFHVFCAECIRTRYETRQRKCPKCNAAFGANDFHKIYLA